MNRGRHNFDEVRYEYYRDSTVLLEAFKGDRYDFRAENSARNWATAYDFPAVREGRVVREEFPERATGIMQAFVFNLRRRASSRTQRVRRAFNLAFDFEEMNKHDLLRPVPAHQLASSTAPSSPPRGCPRARSSRSWRACATRCRRRSSPTPYRNPVNGTPEAVRDEPARGRPAAEGGRLGDQGRQLVNKRTGEPFDRRVPRLRPEPRALRAVLQARRSSGSASDVGPHSSTRRSTRTGCAASTST